MLMTGSFGHWNSIDRLVCANRILNGTDLWCCCLYGYTISIQGFPKNGWLPQTRVGGRICTVCERIHYSIQTYGIHARWWPLLFLCLSTRKVKQVTGVMDQVDMSRGTASPICIGHWKGKDGCQEPDAHPYHFQCELYDPALENSTFHPRTCEGMVGGQEKSISRPTPCFEVNNAKTSIVSILCSKEKCRLFLNNSKKSSFANQCYGFDSSLGLALVARITPYYSRRLGYFDDWSDGSVEKGVCPLSSRWGQVRYSYP
jgi:hypothetical protein